MSVYRPPYSPQMFPFGAVTRTSQKLRTHQSPGLDVREHCKTSELQNFSTGREVPTVFEFFFLVGGNLINKLEKGISQ